MQRPRCHLEIERIFSSPLVRLQTWNMLCALEKLTSPLLWEIPTTRTHIDTGFISATQDNKSPHFPTDIAPAVIICVCHANLDELTATLKDNLIPSQNTCSPTSAVYPHVIPFCTNTITKLWWRCKNKCAVLACFCLCLNVFCVSVFERNVNRAHRTMYTEV